MTAKSGTNLIIMSDHGVVRSLWESELSNHGDPRDGNESFLFIYDKSVQKSREPLEWEHVPRETPHLSEHGESNSLLENQHEVLGKFQEINSFEVSSTLTQLFKDVNVPINSIGVPKPLSRKNSVELKRLRMVEMQVYQYFQSLNEEKDQEPQEQEKKNKVQKDKIDHPVLKRIVLESPFNSIVKKIDSGKLRESTAKEFAVQVDSIDLRKEIQEYSKYIEELVEKIKDQLKNKSNTERLEKDALIVLLFLVFFVCNGLFLLFELSKSSLSVKLIVFSNLFCLILPICCFLLIGYIDEHGLLLLVPFSFALSTIVFVIIKRINKSSNPSLAEDLKHMIDSNLGFFFLNFSILVYDWMVSFDNFVFFYFKNPVLQGLSIILMVFYLTLTIKVLNLSPNEQLNQILGFLIAVLGLFIFIYEMILMLSNNYLQTMTMMHVSQCVYVLGFICLGLSAFLRKVGSYMFFFLFHLGIFWFGSNYIRIVFSLIMTPFLFFFVSINRKVKNYASKFSHAVFLLILQSMLLFYLLR